MSASSLDPDIQAAYSGSSPLAQPPEAYDPDIAAAFTQEEKAKDNRQKPVNVGHNPGIQTVVGLGENALSGITGGAGSLADAITLSAPGTHDWAYRPRTAAGQMIQKATGQAIAPVLHEAYNTVGDVVDAWGGNREAAIQTAEERVPEALGAVGTVSGIGGIARGLMPRLSVTGAPEAVALTPEEVVQRSAQGQSMGAAGSAPNVSAASPELQQAISDAARKTGGAVNPEVLAKQLKADEFDIQLTKGQATGDGAQLADEFNTRNQNPAFAERKAQTNQKLIDGINGIKEDVAPAAAVDHEANAQTVIDAYKDKYAPIAADAKAKWTKFQDAAGGALPLEPGDFTTQVGNALKKSGKTRYLPSDVAGDIKDIDDGEPFTVERWDNLKTNLAAAQRTAERTGNGNAALAVSAARDAVENYQFPNLDPKLQAMNADARAATAKKYAMLRSDPAMDAAVNDGVSKGQLSPEAKGYMEKYFLKGNKADLANAQANLADNPDAKGAIAGAVTNELKKAAGIDLYRNDGNFSQSGYNTRLNELQPRIKYLMDSDAADKAFRLGDVARDAMRQPTGYGFNNSGTSVTAKLAKRVGAGAINTVEHVANMATGKLKLGTGAREEIQNWRDSKWVEDSLKPGAGLDQLQTKP